jgi:hypothetical protein
MDAGAVNEKPFPQESYTQRGQHDISEFEGPLIAKQGEGT